MRVDLLALAIGGIALLVYLGLLSWRFRKKKLSAAVLFPSVSQFKMTAKSWRVEFRWIIPALRVAAIVFLLIGFIKPQKGEEIVQTAREGIAIQMLIDRSSSMKEPLDYRGDELTRLEVVKRVFEEFILGNGKELKGRPNDMIGLISFSGFVEDNAPLTLDHQTLVNFARTITPAIKIEDGTMIGDAIYYSVLRLIATDELFKKNSDKDGGYKVKSKIIILLTDGQQTQGGMNPIEAAQFAKENGIKVYTVAIVSDRAYSRKNTLFGQFFSLMDQPLDTSLIEEVAGITGGVFAKASSGEALVKIYQTIDQLEKSSFQEAYTTYKEQFPVFVIIGFILLIIEVVLSQTVFRKIP